MVREDISPADRIYSFLPGSRGYHKIARKFIYSGKGKEGTEKRAFVLAN